MTDRHTQVVLWACHSVQERAVVVRRLLLIRVPVTQILAGTKKLLQSGIQGKDKYKDKDASLAVIDPSSSRANSQHWNSSGVEDKEKIYTNTNTKTKITTKK